MQSDAERESFDTIPTPRAVTEAPVTPQKTAPDAQPAQDADTRARLDRVLLSDAGIPTLLARLKQSLSSAREFSVFLKERAVVEKQHSLGITRLTRGTHDLVGRPESRQGSFAHNYQEIGLIHDRMARNGEDFAQTLQSMSEELQEITAYCERGRKQWKHTGLEAEKRASDADEALEKARQRYWNAADQYDRVRTGEKQGAKFGLKGPKSAAQHEDSLLSKANNADQEYQSRIEFAQTQRHELLNSSRPQAVRELQNLIRECDSAVSMQIQKFALLNEKLLLGNGLCISPLKAQDGGATLGSQSLREIAHGINDQKDFEDYVLSQSGRVGPAPNDIKYEKHPALIPAQSSQAPPDQFNTSSRTDTGFNTLSGPPPTVGQTSGVVPSPPYQQNTYPGPPPASTGSNAPHAPSVGALPVGGKSSFEAGRPDPLQGRNDNDFRVIGNQTQHKPGQAIYDARENSPQTNITTSRVNDHQGPGIVGPSSGLGRGQPPVTTGLTTSGSPAQSPYGHGGRGTSLGRPGDFHTDGRGPLPGSSYQTRPSDGKGPGQGPGYRPYEPDSRGPQLGPSYQTHQTEVRSPQTVLGHQTRQGEGPPLGSGYQAHQADTRGPQQGATYQTNPGDLRGPQNVPNTHGITGAGGPNNNSNVSPVLGGPLTSGRGPSGRPNLPPLKPVFGVPLDELFRRDGQAVPTIVYQCVQAVDVHGLDTEGIYRVSGSAQHVMELKAQFDHDSSSVNLRNPAAFFNDISAVTTLLKHFLRDLPDPLLPSAQYSQFIQAAKLEDDIVRRDSLHAIINALPDPNYATLRTLVLHLNRVAQRCGRNRMTASNLAIVFGPTLMGGHSGGSSGEIQDAGWQARVIETILNNTFEIFDDDD